MRRFKGSKRTMMGAASATALATGGAFAGEGVSSGLLGAVCAVTMMSCGGSHSSSGPSLVGTGWAYEQSTTLAQALTFHSDGTYEFLRMELTSSTTANTFIQTGTYTSTSSQMTLTPQEASCSGTAPVDTVGYVFEGGNLVLSGPTGSVIYSPDTRMASSNLAYAYGCFDSQGNFSQSPLGPVSN
jgi:hypothetical protein